MKKLIVFMLFCLGGVDLYGSHIVGGDISYRHINGDTYEILVRVYRDCFYGLDEAQFDDPASVGVFDWNDSLIMDLRIDYVSDDTLDAVFADACLNVPGDVCVHTTEYRTMVSLNPLLLETQFYKFVYQRCCRNETITNITNPNETGASFTIDLTYHAMELENKSPDFGQPAPIFICLGESVDYNHGATEVEGDNLMYRFCDPKTGSSSSFPKPQPPLPPPYNDVTFSEGFDLNTLLGDTSNPLTINSETGFITGIPEIQGQFVVGICVDEFRMGELISTVRRDFQYNVGSCLEIEAMAEAPAAQCDDLTVEFENESTFSDDFMWYFDFEGDITLTSTEISPIFTYPDTGTYQVRLIAEPTMSCADTLNFEVLLQYNSTEADFDYVVYDCGENSFVVVNDMSFDDVSGLSEWSWIFEYNGGTLTSTVQNPVFELPISTDGELTLEVVSENGCISELTKEVETGGNELLDELVLEHDICIGDDVLLFEGINANLDYEFLWTPSVGLDNATSPNPTASPEETTTYSVIASALDGICVSEAEVIVRVENEPGLDFEFEVDCNGLSVNFTNTSINAEDVLWDFGIDDSSDDMAEGETVSFQYPDFGSYTVTLRTKENHICQDDIEIQIDLVPKILISDFDFKYTNCSTEQIVIDFENTSENSLDNTISYEWTFGSLSNANEENPTLVIDSSIDLSISLMITTAEGCSDTYNEILDLELIELELSNVPLQACIGSSVPLNPGFNPEYSYNWNPTNSLNDATIGNPIATPTETTEYTVEVSYLGADTCIISSNVEVFVPNLIGLNLGQDIFTCEETITLQAETNVDVDLNYFLNGEAVNNSGVELIVNVSGQNEIIALTEDGFGCVDSDTILISGGPVNVDALGDYINCNDINNSLLINNLDQNDTLSYLWTPSDAFGIGTDTANPTLTNQPGLYDVEVNIQNQYGCSYHDSLMAIIYDAEAIFDFDFEIQCNGNTISFQNHSISAFDYYWDFGVEEIDSDISTEESPDFTYPAPGEYEVTLFTVHSVDCVESTSKVVTVPENVLQSDFDFHFSACEENAVFVQFNDNTINNSGEQISYLWEFEGQGQSNLQNPNIEINASEALIVTLEVETATNCTSVKTDTIEIEVIESVLVTQLQNCHGSSVALNPSGNPDYTYDWTPIENIDDNSSPNPIASPTETTIYTANIEFISADTCSISQTVEVIVPPIINLTLSDTTISCGEPILIAATTEVNTEINWVDSNGELYSGPEFEVLPNDSLTFIATATSEFGCTEIDSIQIQNSSIEIIADDELTLCDYDSIQLNIEVNSNIDQLIYNWISSPNGQILEGTQMQNPIVTTLEHNQPVIFLVEVQNSDNCTALDSIQIISNLFDPNSMHDNLICHDVPSQINLNADDRYNYIWTPANGLNQTNIPSPIATLTEAQMYLVNISLDTGDELCQQMDTVFVEVNPLQNLHTSSDTTLCVLEDLTLQAHTDDSTSVFEWSLTPTFDEILAQSSSITINMGGISTYYIRVTDDLGCVEQASTTVTNIPINASLPQNLIHCINHEQNITVTNNDSSQNLDYLWSPLSQILNGADTETITINPPQDLTYQVIVTNQFNCMDTLSTLVQLEDLSQGLFIEANPDTILLGSDEYSQLTTIQNSDYTYFWTPDTELNFNDIFNPQAQPEETTEYQLTIQSINNCIIEQSVVVVVVDLDCKEPYIFIPSGFSPNGDSENDELYVYGNNIEEMNLAIYNRWGELVFESSDQNIGWDGTYKGKNLNPDVYGYYLKVKCINGQDYFKKGNITLLK